MVATRRKTRKALQSGSGSVLLCFKKSMKAHGLSIARAHSTEHMLSFVHASAAAFLATHSFPPLLLLPPALLCIACRGASRDCNTLSQLIPLPCFSHVEQEAVPAGRRSSSSAPSDDYIAYASGQDNASPARTAQRRKYIIVGVVAVVVVVLLVAIIGYAIYKKDEDDKPSNPDLPAVATKYRLPANVVPVTYDLNLAIDLDQFWFWGRVAVHARIINNTMPAFVMHSMLLNVTNVSISVDSNEVATSQYTYYLSGQDEGTGYQYLVIQGVGAYKFPITDNLNVTVHFDRSLPTNTASGLFRYFLR